MPAAHQRANGKVVPGQHVIKGFDEELLRLDGLIKEIGEIAAYQLGAALDALAHDDSALAADIVERDAEVDRLESEICHLALRLIALRQPTGRDLRQAFSVYKSATEFERIGDYAANLAKRLPVLQRRSLAEPRRAILEMGWHARRMTEDIIHAFVARDAPSALAIWLRDQELDIMHTVLFRDLLTRMMEDPANVTACAHLLFVAKNLERAGDHVTNIAESIHFLVRGTAIERARAKLDMASFSQQTGFVEETALQRWCR
jgi:phosphate transport system protein